MVDYSKFLPYLDDSVDTLIDQFKNTLLERTTVDRCREIAEELKIYLNHFRNMKLRQHDKVIDDHVGAILCSYMINPRLDIRDRDAHYNGCWYALWGDINKQSREEVKKKCRSRNPGDVRWTEVCVAAVDEFYDAYGVDRKENFVQRLLKGRKKDIKIPKK